MNWSDAVTGLHKLEAARLMFLAQQHARLKQARMLQGLPWAWLRSELLQDARTRVAIAEYHTLTAASL